MCNKNIFSENKEQSSSIKDNMNQIKQGLQDISQYVKSVLSSLKRRISFDEYLEITSEYLDDRIIKMEDDENLTFIAGKCKFSISMDKKELNIITDLYFKDIQNEWIQRTIKGKTLVSNFKEETQKNTLTNIYREGLELKVEPPIKGD